MSSTWSSTTMAMYAAHIRTMVATFCMGGLRRLHVVRQVEWYALDRALAMRGFYDGLDFEMLAPEVASEAAAADDDDEEEEGEEGEVVLEEEEEEEEEAAAAAEAAQAIAEAEAEGLTLARSSKSGSSGFLSVYRRSLNSGRFQARLKSGGGKVHLGSYMTAEKAALAVARHKVSEGVEGKVAEEEEELEEEEQEDMEEAEHPAAAQCEVRRYPLESSIRPRPPAR